MFKEIINWIKNYCGIYINRLFGIKLNAKRKTISTKVSKERFVKDDFNLEGIIRDLSDYNYEVEISYHFSKFLKSYIISENNANNILTFAII